MRRSNAPRPLIHALDQEGQGSLGRAFIDHEKKTVRFEVRTGKGTPPDPPKVWTVETEVSLSGLWGKCCRTISTLKMKAWRSSMEVQLMAIVAEGHSRAYLFDLYKRRPTTGGNCRTQNGFPMALAEDPRNIGS